MQRDEYQILPYSGGTPGADTGTTVLFDSTVLAEPTPGSNPLYRFLRYVLSLGNPQAGTVRLSASQDNGKTWKPVESIAVAAATTSNNKIALSIEPHQAVLVEWVNGGAAQTGWYVAQGLDDGQAPFGAAAGSGGSSAVTTTQLPATLGQKTKAGSTSVVLSSDWVDPQLPPVLGPNASSASLSTVAAPDAAEHKAASLRGAIRGEELAITVAATSKTFTVPAAWLSKHVRIQADGGDVYYQISLTGTAAVADIAARATESGTPIALTAAASGNGCFKIPSGTFFDIPFPASATTFALIGSAACVARTHLAET